MTNEQKYKIAELRQSGYGYANIADALGPVSYTHLTLPTNREV